MTELELYKFVNDNNIEWHIEDNDGVEDVLLFPSLYQIKEFNELLPSCIFDDYGIDCVMKEGYFAFWMREICEYNGIEFKNVFDKNELWA